jgi:hypothetical protein
LVLLCCAGEECEGRRTAERVNKANGEKGEITKVEELPEKVMNQGNKGISECSNDPWIE